MTAIDLRRADGVAMFARYAYAPNQLGYCGPPDTTALAGDEREVRAAAKRFSGAWPYLRVLARLTGIEDPLDARIVEAYWLGRDLDIDLVGFGAELLAVLGPQAGHYWTHLTPALLADAAADHAFHVFGVYPWSRLLGRGADQHPLHVLDNCRIRWGTVTSRDSDEIGDQISVLTRRLIWDGTILDLAEPSLERVRVSIEGRSFLPDVAAGDVVALHWDWLTDRLSTQQVDALAASTLRQLAATNRRAQARR